MKRQTLLCALALACGGPPEPPPPPPPDPATVRAEAVSLAAAQPPPPPPPPAPAGESAAMADLVFIWNGVGPLYQGFFTTQDVVTKLAEELGPWVGGRANVAVHWDEEEDTGRIRLVLLPGTLRQPVRADGATLQLQDLAPLTTALARYRSAIASRFDLRVESFRVELESVRGVRACVIGVTGTHPPDGRVINPCVQINGIETCGRPGPNGVEFAPAAAEDLNRCLSPAG